MTTPFSLVLADILLGLAQGHRFFEIVYKLNERGLRRFQEGCCPRLASIHHQDRRHRWLCRCRAARQEGEHVAEGHDRVPVLLPLHLRQGPEQARRPQCLPCRLLPLRQEAPPVLPAEPAGSSLRRSHEVLEEPDDTVTKAERDANLAVADSTRSPFDCRPAVRLEAQLSDSRQGSRPPAGHRRA